MSQYLFRAKTREGFVVKLLSEYLSSNLKFPPFRIDQNGIYLRATDQNTEILIDISLSRENFTIFKCPKLLNFVINSTHFYRLLKTIKKKDSVTMFINEQCPMKLGISVEQNDENSDKVTTYINITYIQPEDIVMPEGYNQPISVTSKHFQKLKTLHSIGNEMKVTVCGQVIKFFVNGKNLFSREISIGEEVEDYEEDVKNYCQTFSTSYITQLTKCAGQSGNVQLFYHEELPLQIKMRIGTLGILTVYIKSKELVEMLEQDDTNGETDFTQTLESSSDYNNSENNDEADDEEEQENNNDDEIDNDDE